MCQSLVVNLKPMIENSVLYYFLVDLSILNHFVPDPVATAAFQQVPNAT